MRTDHAFFTRLGEHHKYRGTDAIAYTRFEVEVEAADTPSPNGRTGAGRRRPAATIDEFRVRAVTAHSDEFLVRGGRLYASRCDAESALTTDRRRYRWPHSPAKPENVIEVRAVPRSPWAAVD